MPLDSLCDHYGSDGQNSPPKAAKARQYTATLTHAPSEAKDRKEKKGQTA